MNKNMDMTTGNVFKKIIIFSLPLMLSNVIQFLFNITDLAVVGQFVGPHALGAVGSTTILITLFVGLLIGMGGGINSLVARYKGSNKIDDMKNTIHTSFLISLYYGLLLALIGVALTVPLLRMINTKSDLLYDSALYFKIYCFGLPALALFNFGNGVYSAIGNTKKPLIFLSISGILNVCLNMLFVIVFKLSVAGVAISTVIAQYLSAILIITSLLMSKNDYKLEAKNITIKKENAIEVLSIGIPAGMQSAIFSIANLFLQTGVNSFDTIMVDGNSAAANADTLIYSLMNAFYIAGASFIAQNFGAKKKDRIKQSFYASMLYSFLIGFVLGLTLLIFGRQFLMIFTNDVDAINAGMYRIKIMGFSYGISAFMDSGLSSSRGLGKTKIPLIIVISGSCIFRVIWIYTLFRYFHTIESLYLLYPVSWTITGIAELIYFYIIYKKLTKDFE